MLTEFLIIDKKIARDIDLDAAGIYEELRQQFSKGDEWVLLDSVSIQKNLGLTRYVYLDRLNKLRDKGYIRWKLGGIPAKRYFQICSRKDETT